MTFGIDSLVSWCAFCYFDGTLLFTVHTYGFKGNTSLLVQSTYFVMDFAPVLVQAKESLRVGICRH